MDARAAADAARVRGAVVVRRPITPCASFVGAIPPSSFTLAGVHGATPRARAQPRGERRALLALRALTPRVVAGGLLRSAAAAARARRRPGALAPGGRARRAPRARRPCRVEQLEAVGEPSNGATGAAGRVARPALLPAAGTAAVDASDGEANPAERASGARAGRHRGHHPPLPSVDGRTPRRASTLALGVIADRKGLYLMGLARAL